MQGIFQLKSGNKCGLATILSFPLYPFYKSIVIDDSLEITPISSPFPLLTTSIKWTHHRLHANKKRVYVNYSQKIVELGSLGQQTLSINLSQPYARFPLRYIYSLRKKVQWGWWRGGTLSYIIHFVSCEQNYA